MDKLRMCVLIIVRALISGCVPVPGSPASPAPSAEALPSVAPTSAPPTLSPTPLQLTPIELAMGYIPSVQFAPFYVAQERGYFRDAGIDVKFRYGFESDLLKLVGTNQLPFMIGSGEETSGRSRLGALCRVFVCFATICESGAGIRPPSIWPVRRTPGTAAPHVGEALVFQRSGPAQVKLGAWIYASQCSQRGQGRRGA
jgi:hypothetical protein